MRSLCVYDGVSVMPACPVYREVFIDFSAPPWTARQGSSTGCTSAVKERSVIRINTLGETTKHENVLNWDGDHTVLIELNPRLEIAVRVDPVPAGVLYGID
jgi:hypothetical protein